MVDVGDEGSRCCHSYGGRLSRHVDLEAVQGVGGGTRRHSRYRYVFIASQVLSPRIGLPHKAIGYV